MSDYYNRDEQYRLNVDPGQPAEGDPMAAEHETADDASPHFTVGDELRMRREAMGKSVADIVDAVRIQARYIEALEENRLEDLPGTVYAIGFVRTYAECLGLDGAEAVARYKEETEGLKSQNYVMPEPLEEGKVPTAAILMVAVVLAAAAYGVWYYLSLPGGRFAHQVPEVPERLSTVTEVPAPPALPTSPSSDEAAQALAPTVATPAPEQDMATAPTEATVAPAPATAPVPPATPPVPVEREATQSTTSPAPAPPPAPAEATAEAPAEAPATAPVEPSTPPSPQPAQDVAVAPPPAAPVEPPTAATEPTAQEAPAESPQPDVPTDVVTTVPEVPVIEQETREPTVYGLDNAAARVVITAQEDAWLEVTDSDDARLFSRVLRKGDSYHAPDRDGVKFVTGNAGGLRITVDGQPIPALGPPGQVRRDVKLDPDLLLAGRAWP